MPTNLPGLRVLFAWMFVHPGKKLSFMGNEFAQFIEWDFSKELDWCLLAYDRHPADAGMGKGAQPDVSYRAVVL